MTAEVLAELGLAAFELEPSGLAVLAGPDLTVQAANPAFRAAVPAVADPVGRPAAEVWAGDAGRRLRGTVARVLARGVPALPAR
jgi:hypothetical protein